MATRRIGRWDIEVEAAVAAAAGREEEEHAGDGEGRRLKKRARSVLRISSRNRLKIPKTSNSGATGLLF